MAAPLGTSPGVDEIGSFAFRTIQLNTVAERRDTHQLNDGDEIQRPDVLDDLCLGMQMQARIDRIVHGRSGTTGPFATLVVFGFRFLGLDRARRFQNATITIVFSDEKKPGNSKADPKVIGLWPSGDFVLGPPTTVQIEGTTGGEAGGNAALPIPGTGAQLGSHLVRKWEEKRTFQQSYQSQLRGTITLDTDMRKSGPNNAVRMILSEDTAASSSIVTEFRAAVLLERKNDQDIFTAKVKMKGRAFFLYNAIRAIRDITPFAPANDPVRFQPGVSYLREATMDPAYESRLRSEITETELTDAQLSKVAGVLGTTVLTTDV